MIGSSGQSGPSCIQARSRRRGLRALANLVRVPGLPAVPGFVALLGLRFPWLVPPLVRWRFGSKGFGFIFARLVRELGSERANAGLGADAVGQVFEHVGVEHGEALRRHLDWGRNPLECAQAVALANRLYAVAASVVAVGADEARVITPGCPWFGEEWWGKAPCGVFSRYEVGLTRGLNPRVRLRYEAKRTRGDSKCVGLYSWAESSKPEESSR